MGISAVSIKGLHIVRKHKPGKPVRWYVYAWRNGGPLIKTKIGGAKPVIGPDEVAAYHEAVAATRAVKKETIAGGVRDYRKSPEWARMAATTRNNWSRRLDLIEEKWGETPLSLWSDPRMVAKVVAWRDTAQNTPREADYRITVLKAMLEWLRLRGRVTVNVAAGVPQLYEGGNRAEIIWTDADIAAFAEHASEHVLDGLMLAAYTGLRRADLVALKWSEVGDQVIGRVTQKSSRRRPRKAVVPIFSELRSLLADLRKRHRKAGVETVLVNSFGRPWTADGFGQCVTRAAKDAGIKHDDGRPKHLHDVRGTFATKLILAGLTDQQVADVLGWAPERVSAIRRVYVDQARVVVALAERLNAGAVNRPVNQRGKTDAK